MNSTHDKILALIESQGKANAGTMSRYFDLAPNYIQDVIKQLYRARKIHISDYKPDARNCMRPLYSVGAKLDAIKPPVKLATQKRHERLIARQEPFVPRRDVAAQWMTHI